MAHNKYLTPLLYLLNDCISAKSTPQILSLKEENTFLFLNFLIIALCNSTDNSTQLIIQLISNTTSTRRFVKNLYTIDANPL